MKLANKSRKVHVGRREKRIQKTSTDTPGRKQDTELVFSKEDLTYWKTTSKECSTTIAEISERVDILNIDTEVPTVEEVKQAIWKVELVSL